MQVAVAVIIDPENRILITRRSLQSSHGGFWEFPGGKLEQGEYALAALVREVKEEVGLDVLACDYLGEVRHKYKENQPISLLIYHVHEFDGQATCREAQMDMNWARLENLKDFQFPAANLEIIELIKQKIAGL